MARSKAYGKSASRRESDRTEVYGVSADRKEFEQRKRKKVNIRRNSPTGGKSKGARAWMKTRHRVRKNLLGR